MGGLGPLCCLKADSIKNDPRLETVRPCEIASCFKSFATAVGNKIWMRVLWAMA